MTFVTIEARWFCSNCHNANKHSHDGITDREVYYHNFGEIVKHIIETGHDCVEMQLRDSTSDED